jgi:hypothetical protein
MPERLLGAVLVKVGCSQRRAREARQRTADRNAILPLIHGDIHRIHHVELATLHRNVEQTEIPGLMTAQPMADDGARNFTSRARRFQTMEFIILICDTRRNHFEGNSASSD